MITHTHDTIRAGALLLRSFLFACMIRTARLCLQRLRGFLGCLFGSIDIHSLPMEGVAEKRRTRTGRHGDICHTLIFDSPIIATCCLSLCLYMASRCFIWAFFRIITCIFQRSKRSPNTHFRPPSIAFSEHFNCVFSGGISPLSLGAISGKWHNSPYRYHPTISF